MDRYELKVTLSEIDALIAERSFKEAAEIADTVDWEQVTSVRTLCKVSDLYKLNRRYEKARELLELAYARYPRGRHIIYSLCELQLKLNNYVKALTLYNEYISVAPRDPDRYILQYKLYKAQNVSIAEQIAVLEEYNRRDFREKWAFELAMLYQKAGRTALCASACDEIIACFGDGRYVIRALELKNTVARMTPDQIARYERLTGRELPPGVYESFGAEEALPEEPETGAAAAPAADRITEDDAEPDQGGETAGDSVTETDTDTETDPEADAAAGADGETDEWPDEETEPGAEPEADTELLPEPEDRTAEETPDEEEDAAIYDVEVADSDLPEEAEERRVSSMEDNMFAQRLHESMARSVQDMENYDPYLRQETDGQYAMVIEEEQAPERQITGQLSLTEIMAQWNRVHRESEQKRSDETRKRVIENTGPIIRQFYEENGMDPGGVEKIQKKVAVQDVRRATTKSWDPREVRKALRTRREEEDEDNGESGVRFDTHLFVTEDVREFPDTFAVEQPQEELTDDPPPAEIVDTPGNLGLPEPAEPEEAGAHPDLRAHRPMGKEDTAPILRAPENIRQMEEAVKKMRLEASSGNVLITGDEGVGSLRLTRELLQRFRRANRNFVGRTAKTTGPGVNEDNLTRAIPRLPFGVLIIENAAAMTESAADALERALRSPGRSVIVILLDRRAAIDGLMESHPGLKEMFTARIDIAPLDDGALLGYARRYADKQDCTIDTGGAEALRERIDILREQGYDATLRDVRTMVDEAVYYAGRMSLGNLMERVGRRGMEQEKLVLRDKDFRHY